MKISIALALTTFLTLAQYAGAREIPTVAPEKAGLSSERLARIKPHMQAYIDNGKLVGMVTVLARNGQIVHSETYGKMDIETGRPMQADTIFRIYSMTKPVTAVALMMLYEEDRFQLNDPISKYIPELKGLKVYAGKGKDGPLLQDAKHEPTIRELLSHSAGFAYGIFENGGDVEKLYKTADILNKEQPLKQMIEKLAKLPLLYQPGESWSYSVSNDVAGYLVEVLSGMPFDRFMKERIFDPLDMHDTGFRVPADKTARFASNYFVSADNQFNLVDDASNKSGYVTGTALLSGGGGLVSTSRDYLRFAQMLLNGGELYGTRILGRKTVELMMMNHLAPGVGLGLPVGPGGAPVYIPGYGYGLGFAVMADVARSGSAGSVGEIWWAGAANTEFWIDPKEKMIALVMTQRLPGDLPLQNDMKVLGYQALIDAPPQ